MTDGRREGARTLSQWCDNSTHLSENSSCRRMLRSYSSPSPRPDHDDSIEELSQGEGECEDDTLPPSVSQSSLARCTGKDNSVAREPEVDASSRSRVARVVAWTAVIFLSACLMMVGFSLLMSKDIDEIVRNSNLMLKKHNERISDLPSAANETEAGSL